MSFYDDEITVEEIIRMIDFSLSYEGPGVDAHSLPGPISTVGLLIIIMHGCPFMLAGWLAGWLPVGWVVEPQPRKNLGFFWFVVFLACFSPRPWFCS